MLLQTNAYNNTTNKHTYSTQTKFALCITTFISQVVPDVLRGGILLVDLVVHYEKSCLKTLTQMLKLLRIICSESERNKTKQDCSSDQQTRFLMSMWKDYQTI